jgi:hypothetical protein
VNGDLRRLFRLLAELRAELRKVPRFRRGVVAAVNADGTVDVFVSGATDARQSIVTLATVAVDDDVWLVKQDGFYLCIGRPQ